MTEACLSKEYPNKKMKVSEMPVWKWLYKQEFTESVYMNPFLQVFPGQTPKSWRMIRALSLSPHAPVQS